jgi:hypothetical protein
LSTLSIDQVIALLSRYVAETGDAVDLLLVGALALPAYGVPERSTNDVDGEIVGSVASLYDFLTSRKIPADLTQNFSGWSVVAMPPGYRDRATDMVNQPGLRIRVLSPLDFIIAKLRRGTDEDVQDALSVARRHGMSVEEIRSGAQAALTASPEDTALFLFRKTVELFCRDLALDPND